MDLREFIIWLGLVAIIVIVWDGMRRMKQSKGGATRRRKKTEAVEAEKPYDPEELEKQAQIARELPNGGARVREMTVTEKEQIENRLNLRERVPMLMERVEVEVPEPEPETVEQPAAEQVELDFTAEVEEQEPISEPQDAADAVTEVVEVAPVGSEPAEEDDWAAVVPADERIEPTFGEAQDSEELEECSKVELQESPEPEAAELEPVIDEATEEPVVEQKEPEPEMESAPVEDLVIMHVMARDGRELSGSEILELLLASGLRYGPMDIFHYRNPKGQTEFSLANCVHPGTFNPDSMSQVNTPGITLFLQLPSTADAMESFEHMYEMAVYLAKKLGADVLDEDHSTVTAQRCEYYREKLRAFARSKLIPAH